MNTEYEMKRNVYLSFEGNHRNYELLHNDRSIHAARSDGTPALPRLPVRPFLPASKRVRRLTHSTPLHFKPRPAEVTEPYGSKRAAPAAISPPKPVIAPIAPLRRPLPRFIPVIRTVERRNLGYVERRLDE